MSREVLTRKRVESDCDPSTSVVEPPPPRSRTLKIPASLVARIEALPDVSELSPVGWSAVVLKACVRHQERRLAAQAAGGSERLEVRDLPLGFRARLVAAAVRAGLESHEDWVESVLLAALAESEAGKERCDRGDDGAASDPCSGAVSEANTAARSVA